MVAIPGGKFLMVSPIREGDFHEKPQHEIIIQPFLMSKYLITQAQWREIASLPKIERNLQLEPSYFIGDDRRPVERISWYDAVEFCQRLSKKTGKEYRLPSEAEWEYACRAGTTTQYHFGDKITDKLANYGKNLDKTTVVGKYPPNAFDLYDMHGNVWEWCQDDWYKNYEDAPNDGKACILVYSTRKVMRGGSWYSSPRDCRSAFRLSNNSIDKFNNIGFRVACRGART